jgi:hypothetical protein
MEYNNNNNNLNINNLNINNSNINNLNGEILDDNPNKNQILLSDTLDFNNFIIKNSIKINDINEIHDFIDKNIYPDNKLNPSINKDDTSLEKKNKDDTSLEKKNKNIIVNNSDTCKNNCKEVNNSEVLVLYKELVDDFNNFNDLTIKGLFKLKSDIKKIEKIILKISSGDKKKSLNKNNDWGFTEQRSIPKSIEIFFNTQPNEKLSRTSVGKLFQDYIQKNNLKGNLSLKNKIDKRIYKFDDKLAKLFGVSDNEKKKINECVSSNVKYPNGFNFYNYQRWIKKLYLEDMSS